MAIQEGKTAPAFTLPDQNGKKVALKDFRGKNITLSSKNIGCYMGSYFAKSITIVRLK